MWNDPNRQLDRSSTIPDDEFLKPFVILGKLTNRTSAISAKLIGRQCLTFLKGN